MIPVDVIYIFGFTFQAWKGGWIVGRDKSRRDWLKVMFLDEEKRG